MGVEVREILICWFTTASLLALVAFLLKVGGTFSRATFVLFCFITPVALLGVRRFTKVVLAEAISNGFVGRPDVVLIGEFNEIRAFGPQDLLAICGATDVKHFALSEEDDPESARFGRHPRYQSPDRLCPSARLQGNSAGAALERF